MSAVPGRSRRFSRIELANWWGVTVVVGLVAGLSGALVAVQFLRHAACDDLSAQCPDGTAFAIPGMLVGAVAAVLAAGFSAAILALRSDADTARRAAWFPLWLAFLTALAPAVLGVLLMLLGSGQSIGAVLGWLLPAAGAGLASGMPMVALRFRPQWATVAAGSCLLAGLVLIVNGQRLFLLLPFAVLCVGWWTIALGLLLRSGRYGSTLAAPSCSAISRR